jgi:hypothetical protein
MPDNAPSAPLEVPLLYANSIRLAIGYTDARIFFGEIVPGSAETSEPGVMTPSNPKIIDRLCVVVSPELLPQLAAGFARAATNYEERFGALRPLPQNISTVIEEPKRN